MCKRAQFYLPMVLGTVIVLKCAYTSAQVPASHCFVVSNMGLAEAEIRLEEFIRSHMLTIDKSSPSNFALREKGSFMVIATDINEDIVLSLYNKGPEGEIIADLEEAFLDISLASCADAGIDNVFTTGEI